MYAYGCASRYGSFNADWQAEVAYWQAQGMRGKLGVGFCPTCNEPHGEAPAQIASKFAAAVRTGDRLLSLHSLLTRV